MAENLALWLPRKRGRFTIGPAPRPVPAEGEIAVRVRALAVNPFDRLMQTMGDLITPYLAYPFIPGSDVAGEVIAVGRGVTRFRVGDRVLGHAVGSDRARNRAAEGGFQHEVILLAHMASPLPDDLAFEAATVLPLALSTAACGLFQPDFLALAPPAPVPKPSGKTVLVWGGSTSVGMNAIQLAVAAGCRVVATASRANFGLLERLGAAEMFDYRDAAAVGNIRRALHGRDVAGAIAIGVGATERCIDIVAACEGNRFVAVASPPVSFDDVPAAGGRLRRMAPIVASMLFRNARLALKAHRNGVNTKMIWGSSLLGNAVGPMIYEDFLPEALASGRYLAAPEAIVVGHGLASIAEALERQRRGVSARKLVVTL